MGGWANLSRDQQSRENAVCKTIAGLGQAMGGEIAYAPGLEMPADHVVISIAIGESRVKIIVGDEYAQQLARSFYDLAKDYTIPGELVGAAFETAAGSLVSQLEGVFGTSFTVQGISNGEADADAAEARALPFQGSGGTLDGLTFFIAADTATPPLQTGLVPNIPKSGWVMDYPVRLASLGLTVKAFDGLSEMDILVPPGMTALEDGMAAALWINNYTGITGVVRGNVFIISGLSRGRTMAADDEDLEEADETEAIEDDEDLDEDEDESDEPEASDEADEADEADDDEPDDEADDGEPSESDDEADQAAAEALLTGAGIDTLPVRVDFEIGRLELSFAELSALTAGQSFDLGSPPGDAVTLRVSGRKVGAGELIEIDGRVGVRIKHLIK